MSEAIIMQKSELESMMKTMKADIVAEVKAMMAVQQPQESDVKGRRRIAKCLGCSWEMVTRLAEAGTLGRMLWKNEGKRTATIRLNNCEKAKVRCTALQQMMPQEREAWFQLGADQAEKAWREKGL